MAKTLSLVAASASCSFGRRVIRSSLVSATHPAASESPIHRTSLTARSSPYTSAMVLTVWPSKRRARATMTLPRLRSRKNSGGGWGGRGKSGPEVLERDAVIPSHGLFVLARLDPVPDVGQPGPAVDEHRLSEGALGVCEEQGLFRDGQHQARRPPTLVGDAGQVALDHLVEHPLAGA